MKYGIVAFPSKKITRLSEHVPQALRSALCENHTAYDVKGQL